ncbi:AMP-binding protein [uncultured Alistipes sp.]|uniref:phenylacetate--CoA ligase family protein n=1 Tax=uncultured Alistipes sp. TaxID=538949 RepID=UPI0025E8B1A7|nr:AMP-binding protein [uncultured Alistipes sp.]
MQKNPAIQFASATEIKAWQEERLQKELRYLQEHSPFYREMFRTAQTDPAQIRRIEDLQQLPVTTKDDLQRHNEAFLCVPRHKIVDYVTTSGTLGDPVTFALTENDLQRLAYNEYLSFTTAGITPGDIMQLMTTLDRRFMAGLAYFMGARELGCGIIRVGNGIPELQWDTISRIQPSFCMVVPSFLTKLIAYAEHNGIDYNRSSLRKAVCIGESLRNPDLTLNTLGQQIASKWPELKLYTTYASTEMQSSFTECDHTCGGHLQPELIIVELLDDNDRPIADGEAGEVTITTLGVEGMPLLRFKTGDLCHGYSTPCQCGRNTLRLSPVIGRKGQMIKYKGTTLFPPALFDILDNVPYIENYIVELSTDKNDKDQIVVRVGLKPGLDFDVVKELKDRFRAKIRVAPEILIDDKASVHRMNFPEMSRKAVKFIDLRG